MMNRLLSRVLKTGLYTGLAVIVLGMVLVLGRGTPASQVQALPFGELFPRLLKGDGAAVLDLGLVILMLTPAARVVAALFGYWREGDRRFALISLIVLIVLIISFTIASLTGTVAG